MNFNLMRDPWVTVLHQDGDFRQMGLLSLLNEACSIRDIVTSNPADKASVLRLLLTMLYWYHGNPKSETPSYPDDWSDLLREEECFNLFGEKRFFQIPDVRLYCDETLEPKVKKGREVMSATMSPATLLEEFPTGSNPLHFAHWSHQDNESIGFSFQACAMALVRLVSFASQGGQGKHQAIHGAPCVHRFLIGKTLADTLLFLWKKRDDLKGEPSWINPSQVHNYSNIGFFLGMTWIPRTVWLCEPNEGDVGTCAMTGIHGPLVRSCYHYKRIDHHRHMRAYTEAGGKVRNNIVWDDPTIVLWDKAIFYEPKDKREKREAEGKSLQPKPKVVRFSKFGNKADLDTEIDLLGIIERGAIHHPNYFDDRAIGEWWVIPSNNQAKIFQFKSFMMRSRDPGALKMAARLLRQEDTSEIHRSMSSLAIDQCTDPDEEGVEDVLWKKKYSGSRFMLKPV